MPFRLKIVSMSHSDAHRIVAVDRMKDGLVLKFADGQCVFFSSAFLHARAGEAEQLNEADPEPGSELLH